MSAALDRVPVAEISARAREVKPGRTALAAVTGVLFAIGWLVAKLLRLAWLACAWAVTAVRIGWAQAQTGPVQPSRTELENDNERLRNELARLNGAG